MTKNIRVVPAILANDAASLEKLVRQAESFADYVQIDIMDGEFVPSRSISYQDVAALKPKFNWEVHLMVRQPEEYIEKFKNAGAQKIIFHFEAKTNKEKTINLVKGLGMLVGLAVNPETAIPEFAPLVKQVDSVLFLSVNPGFYGAEFLPEVLDKIKEFRQIYPDMEIAIDGGVKEENLIEITNSGVDTICIGSAIFNRPSPAAAYRSLAILAATA